MSIEPFTFTTLIPQGYKLLPTIANQAEYEHSLFGAQTITGAWCPNCDKPLLHLASIDTRDPRLGLTHLSLARIPLLYCMRCCISWADGDVNTVGLRQHRLAHTCGMASDNYSGNGCEFHYYVSEKLYEKDLFEGGAEMFVAGEAKVRECIKPIHARTDNAARREKIKPDRPETSKTVSQTEGVSILVYNEGYDEGYLPYPGYPDNFPGTPVMLQPINEKELWYCQRMNRYWEEHLADFAAANYEAAYAFQTQYDYLNDWTHQLGGEPCFWNPPSPLTCPCCEADMPFLAMIEDNASAGTPDLSSGAGGQITFHFCQECSIIGAYVITT